ncbi:hypothetical protein [Zavarzinia aquatilis]|uniref:Uncharacterized protein n=1 Tax=Zavarzinia aquatilis TaxID=2211142 RepID=A0A317EDA1_9PROT|nr:hypothetical protein [Zavarzinia aquatilis]PWR24572.1 hypothetical protein DKG74_07140 [Zavarzinia aquatilis]
MPWFRFDRAFDWRATPRSVVAYPAGLTMLVPGPCADAAEAAGAGRRVTRPAAAKMDKSGRLT